MVLTLGSTLGSRSFLVKPGRRRHANRTQWLHSALNYVPPAEFEQGATP